MTRLIAIAMALLVVATANAQDTVDWSKAEPVSLLLMENQIVPDRLTLQHGVPYVLQLENAGTERHRFTAAEFLAAAIVREPRLLTDDGSEVVLQPAVAIDLYLVPTRPGTYPLSCADHDLDGMIGEIVVE